MALSSRLRLSPHITTNIDRILAQLFKWAQPQIDAYLRAIVMAAEHSGGGIVADVPRTVHDCPDHEDNLILDLAAEVGALLIVSNDTDLLSMSPRVARNTNHRADRVRSEGRCHAQARTPET